MRPAYNKLTNTLELPSAPRGWSPPSDWIDISDVAENEINLLVTDVMPTAFTVLVGSGAGTFSIDWGDGVIQNGLTGNGSTVFYHQYTVNGTPCSEGYNTWKLRICNASADIKTWKIARSPLTTGGQQMGILSAYMDCPGITDYSYAFMYNPGNQATSSRMRQCTIKSFRDALSTSYMFKECYQLESVTLPSTWGSVTNASFMFNVCQSLTSVILPASWGLVNTVQSFFYSCTNLTSVILPSSWGAITSVYYMFGLTKIRKITLPDSWGLVTNCGLMFSTCTHLSSIVFGTSWEGMIQVNSAFENCSFLKSVVLPQVQSNALITTGSIFNNCSSLKSITNAQYLGSQTADTTFSNTFQGCSSLETNLSLSAKLTALTITSASGFKAPLTSIRLTNPTSTFASGINISNTSLDAAALNLLFGDLPAVVGKTINITGCTGAATCTRSIATAKGWTVTG